jgi:hypothetical protein
MLIWPSHASQWTKPETERQQAIGDRGPAEGRPQEAPPRRWEARIRALRPTVAAAALARTDSQKAVQSLYESHCPLIAEPIRRQLGIANGVTRFTWMRALPRRRSGLWSAPCIGVTGGLRACALAAGAPASSQASAPSPVQ